MKICVICDEFIHRGEDSEETTKGPVHVDCLSEPTEENEDEDEG